MRRSWAPVIGLAAVISAAGQRQLPWEPNPLLIGRALYRENCIVCHDIDKPQSKKLGPSFYQVFKRDRMPLSGTRPNRDYVRVRVKFGGRLMPAFRHTLSDKEINLLIDYIASK